MCILSYQSTAYRVWPRRAALRLMHFLRCCVAGDLNINSYFHSLAFFMAVACRLSLRCCHIGSVPHAAPEPTDLHSPLALFA